MFFCCIPFSTAYVNSSEIPRDQTYQVHFKHWGDRGIDDFSHGDTKQDTYHDAVSYAHDHEKDSLGYGGSYCPPSDGNYRIRITGRGWIRLKWTDGSFGTCTASDDNPCGDIRDKTCYTVPMKKGRCYPFTLMEQSSCIWRDATLGLYTKLNSNSETNPTDYIRDYQTPRCLTWYYGSSCTRCTVDCNGNGYCGGKPIADRSEDKCICTSNAGDTFCEAPNKVHNINGEKHGITRKLISADGTIVSEKIVNTMEIEEEDFDDIYQTVVFTGKLYLPQKSSYKLRVISNPGAQLVLNGVTYGKTDRLSCSPDQPTITITSNEISGDHILVPFTLSYPFGCSVQDHHLKIEWQFYRWYTDKGRAIEWSEIPSKYLFAA